MDATALQTALQQLLDELFPALETVETQNVAILQFLKERGVATEKDLAPFLEQAANASNVRWRAARLRVNHLLTGAEKAREASEEKAREADKSKSDEATTSKIDKKQQASPEESAERRSNPEKSPERAESRPADSKAAGDAGTEPQRKDKSRENERGNLDKPADKAVA